MNTEVPEGVVAGSPPIDVVIVGGDQWGWRATGRTARRVVPVR